MTLGHTEPMEKLVYLLWDDGGPAEGDRLAGPAPRRGGAAAPGGRGPGPRRQRPRHRGAGRPRTGAGARGRRPPLRRGLGLGRLLRPPPPVGRGGRRSGPRSAGYLVVESLYEDYGTTPHAPPRSWPDGERSPGSSPWPSSTARRVSPTTSGSTGGTGPSHRCRPNSSPAPATSATRWSGPSPPKPPRSTASSRRPGRRPATWPIPMLFYNATDPRGTEHQHHPDARERQRLSRPEPVCVPPP